MRFRAVLKVLIGAHFIQGLLGLPVDRELYRVKRKGELEDDKGEEFVTPSASVVRKVRRSQDDKELEIRHKRRFFGSDSKDYQTNEQYFRTKMEARSSRSSREDNDITAQQPERFRIRKRAEPHNSLIIGEDSGFDPKRSSDASGSGLWGSGVSGVQTSMKHDDKRSMDTNSLDSLITALRAISAITPEDQFNSDDDVDISGSGLWLAKENENDNDNGSASPDDKLPKFFKEEGTSSASGEDAEHALDMIAKTAEAELNKKVESESGLGGKGEKLLQENGEKLVRRELHGDLATEDLSVALENSKCADDPEQNSDSPSGSADEAQQTEIKISGEPDTKDVESSTNAKKETKGEAGGEMSVKATRSLSDVVLPDSLVREKRSFLPNSLLRADGDLGENEALVGDSLIARFYRDQEARDSSEVSASLPSEHDPASRARTSDLLKRDNDPDHIDDLSEPRVVYTREIRNVPEPIIERPAVFSLSPEENSMDAGFGGDGDDDDEPAIVIHERSIREDGYVGCYEDKSPERDLPTILSVPRLIPDKCRTACREAGHAYAGVQYGYLCRCGDSYGKYSKIGDEQCNAACEGDHMQKCGGFWKSAIYTTEGAMESSKRGNFFHIESVQPLPETEDIFETPRSEIASAGSSQVESSTSASPQPETPTTAQVTSDPDKTVITVKEIPMDPTPQVTTEVSNPQIPVKEVSTAHASQSAPAPVQVQDPSPVSAPVVPPSPQPSAPVLKATSNQNVPIPNASPTSNSQQAPNLSHPNQDQKPQGTHVSQLVYMHQQQDILSKPTPRTIFPAPPGQLKPGTVAYTGTIKLKQSWLDQLQDGESAESKILTGNVEQAFQRVFAKDPNFVKAQVVELREGLVKHNPNTIRKVIAPFLLTFKQGAKGVVEKLKNMVQTKGKLDDMPVYNTSLHIEEYSRVPAKPANNLSAKKEEKVQKNGDEKKRSAVNVPKRPYTIQLFLMKDLFGKKKRTMEAMKA